MSFLPSLLSERARDDGERVALSFKEGGAFRFLTWAEVEQEVSNLSRALGRAGLNSRSQLWVSGDVSVRQLLTVLAALSLDARILVGDDTTAGAATWAFVCGSIELRRLLAKSPATSFGGIVFDDRRARPPTGIGALAYSELIAEDEERTSPAAEVSPFSSVGASRRGFTSLQLQHAFVAALPEASRFAGRLGLGDPSRSSGAGVVFACALACVDRRPHEACFGPASLAARRHRRWGSERRDASLADGARCNA